MIYDDFVYTQLMNERVHRRALEASGPGIETDLNAYSKKYWTDPVQVE